MASTNIVNLIGTLIEEIRDTALITGITHSGTTYTITTADTKDVVVGDWIKISSVDYKVTAMTVNAHFHVESSTAIIGTGTNWTALAPYYYYGTPIMISNTLDKITDNQNKFPVIVLFETMPATVDDGVDTLLERTVSLEMYFMDEANFEDWTHEEYYTNIINKMQTRVDAFIEACEDNSQTGLPASHKETNHSKWNMVRLDKGTNVFNSELSGIQLDIDLDIFKTIPCED
jgi:hypothetical protein